MKTKNKIPMRQCTGCREMKSKKEMLRVLKTTEDEIVLDTTGKVVAVLFLWRKKKKKKRK